MGRTRPALDAGFFIAYRTETVGVPPGAEPGFFDNRMRQRQTQAPARARACAYHKFLISVTCRMANLPGAAGVPSRGRTA